MTWSFYIPNFLTYLYKRSWIFRPKMSLLLNSGSFVDLCSKNITYFLCSSTGFLKKAG